MKRQISSSCVLVLLLCCSRPTLAQDSRSYVSLDGGISLLGSSEVTPSYQQEPATLKFDTGYRADLTFGYTFPRGAAVAAGRNVAVMDISVEVEAGVRVHSFQSIGGVDLAGAGASTDLYQMPVLANVIFGVPLSDQFSVSFGGGVGPGVSFVSTTSAGQDDSTVALGFAYQALARFDYKLTRHFQVGVFYKWLGVSAIDYGDDFQVSAGQQTFTLGESEGTTGHAFGLRAGWSF